MGDLDKLIKGLASTVTERCRQRIEEARKAQTNAGIIKWKNQVRHITGR